MHAISRSPRILRWAGLLVVGSILFSSCQASLSIPGFTAELSGAGAHVFYPGGGVLISDDGVYVGFPGGHVEVSDEGVFVDAPLVDIDICAR